MTRIIVTGATGFIARHVRKYLSCNNMEFSSISRKNFKTLENETKIITNYSDIPPSQIQNYDTMIHLVGIGNQSIKNDFDSINFQLTKRLVKLCIRVGVKKFIYLSGLGVSRHSSLEYFLSKYKAENEIKNSSIDFTIFRPSYIVGRDDLLTKHLKRQIRQGTITIPGSGKFLFQPISINDVTKIIFESLTSKKFSNKTLDMVGPKLITYEKYVRLFSKSKVPIKKISFEQAYHDAITGNGDFGVDDLNLLVGNFVGDSKRLERISNIKLESVV